MIEAPSPDTSQRADVLVRELGESDVAPADSIMRSAFDTFVGVHSVFGDRDYARTRWLAQPATALAAERDGQLVGSNFVTCWGTVGFFGPLTVDPELWDQGIASRLMEATVALLDRCGVMHTGLFTFAGSPKHHGLYQKFGFWPRFLTPVMTKPVSGGPTRARATRYTELSPAERERAVAACRELAATACDGLDLEREIRAVERQNLGEIVLLDDASGLTGMAVCHLGADTEAGSGACARGLRGSAGPGLPGGLRRGEHAPAQRRGLQPPWCLDHRRLALIPVAAPRRRARELDTTDVFSRQNVGGVEFTTRTPGCARD